MDKLEEIDGGNLEERLRAGSHLPPLSVSLLAGGSSALGFEKSRGWASGTTDSRVFRPVAHNGMGHKEGVFSEGVGYSFAFRLPRS